MNDQKSSLVNGKQKVNYVFGYVRGSTSKQEITIQNQQERIQQYIALHSQPGGELHGVEFGGFFSDEGVSGKTPWFERPQGEVLLRQLRRGDHIIIFKLSRASRGNVDLLTSVERLVTAGVSLHSIHEKIDMSTPHGRFFVSVLGAMAQMERETLAENTREAMQYKIRRGLPASKYAPLGWSMRGERRESHYVPNDTERRWCLWIYDQYRSGMKIEAIRASMIQQGVVIGDKGQRMNAGKNDLPFYRPERRAAALRGDVSLDTCKAACMLAKMFVESGMGKWPKIANKRIINHWQHFLAGGSGYEMEGSYVPCSIEVMQTPRLEHAQS